MRIAYLVDVLPMGKSDQQIVDSSFGKTVKFLNALRTLKTKKKTVDKVGQDELNSIR